MITVFCGAMTVYCDAITAQQAVAAFKTSEIQVDAGGGDRVAPSRGMDALGALGGRDLTRPPAAGPPGAGANRLHGPGPGLEPPGPARLAGWHARAQSTRERTVRARLCVSSRGRTRERHRERGGDGDGDGDSERQD